VTIEVFDEPEVAAAKHRAGLRRLFALQMKDAIKYLEKNVPELQKMAVAYMSLGTQEELRDQIIEVALDRAFLLDPLPTDEMAFKKRIEEGRGRLTLIANEVARPGASILAEYACGGAQDQGHAHPARGDSGCPQQLQRLMPKRFLAATPWPQLQHFRRYLKAIDPAAGQAARRPGPRRATPGGAAAAGTALLELVAERKGAVDERMQENAAGSEELRVSFLRRNCARRNR
jgi:ATP-dependent helicase HrpA